MGRKSKADQRRSQIIEAFFHSVTEMGLSNASIRKIAAKAGVQPSVLHHYFSSREEIIEEAVIWFTDRIFKAFQDQVAASQTVAGGLDHPDRADLDLGMAFIFSKGMINENHTGFFLECCVAARHNPRIRKTLADLFSRFRQAIIDQLEQVPGFNGLSEKEQSVLASTVVAVHEGIELQWFADPDAVSLDKSLEITREIVDFFIQKGGRSS